MGDRATMAADVDADCDADLIAVNDTDVRGHALDRHGLRRPGDVVAERFHRLAGPWLRTP